ncbi:MAG TPA: ABC transporter substrate-binding protein [Ilumatobacter sp.]
MRRTAIAALLVGGLLVTGCGDDDAETADTDAPPPADTSDDTSGDTGAPAATAAPAGTDAAGLACADGKTLVDGELTIATGEPAFPPYVIDDAPETGEGFEAAVAMAVAREMGFEGDAVKWIRTTFDAAIQPGPKDFDFNLQQYTITPDRAEVVSFSDPYYTAAQAIFGLADSPAADAATIADLQGLKIGVQASTTSLTYVEEVIQPTSAPLVFNDNAAAKQALDGNQIDAIVADLPTALFITAVEMEGTAVYGQIEGSGTDQFGLLLEKDNPLVECVNDALAALTASGELEAITTEWMADYTEAPIITLT